MAAHHLSTELHPILIKFLPNNRNHSTSYLLWIIWIKEFWETIIIMASTVIIVVMETRQAIFLKLYVVVFFQLQLSWKDTERENSIDCHRQKYQ